MFERNNISFNNKYDDDDATSAHVVYSDINTILSNNKKNTNQFLAICDTDVICIG